MKGVGCRGGARVEGPEGRHGQGLEGVEGRAPGVGDERPDGVGGGVRVVSSQEPGLEGRHLGSEQVGCWGLGSWCDRKRVWPGPLPTWIEPRHQPCGLGRPCALGPHLGADSSRGFQAKDTARAEAPKPEGGGGGRH